MIVTARVNPVTRGHTIVTNTNVAEDVQCDLQDDLDAICDVEILTKETKKRKKLWSKRPDEWEDIVECYVLNGFGPTLRRYTTALVGNLLLNIDLSDNNDTAAPGIDGADSVDSESADSDTPALTPIYIYIGARAVMSAGAISCIITLRNCREF